MLLKKAQHHDISVHMCSDSSGLIHLWFPRFHVMLRMAFAQLGLIQDLIESAPTQRKGIKNRCQSR